ncbi:hypothetical protein TIFTF001_027986 [Ficus carica]|uniref:Uncharacterized protein n=1 Tax=Ficus carica TaxID=3494 RepID=A0AA88J0J7_FICCA|nr:hypothetical protein TIFTF001_027986 [Ficus carica]
MKYRRKNRRPSTNIPAATQQECEPPLPEPGPPLPPPTTRAPSAARRSESRPLWAAQIRRGGVADCPDPAKIRYPQGTVSTPDSVAIPSLPPSWI